ncbi:SGNH/GDSL hydrolase family protein [Nocardioides iriomotensis]|uniref:SGNH/GDSL hydrolase family protein n=1 Tax=Nocardioides iriomotensis TaxID=715784 RepID=A0A4Q5IVX9_9ACTN|nr:SGNH/GDSL hydrolase family protein [Nocardioides iriomotensis]RYU09268.1 SGNH/GDSL hydrolase family protein [Nocardioides iriomotensis]
MRLPRGRFRPVAAVAAGVLVSAAIGAAGARQVLHSQARAARRAIGKPLGEEAHRADRVYKKKYGATLDLLVLGDSIAAGLGAEKPSHTLGAQLASRTAKATGRAVRLRTEAVVGSESSVLAAQLGVLPSGYRPDVAVIVVGGNDVTHRVRVSESSRHLAAAIEAMRARGAEVVVGTCPDLGLLLPVPQPLRRLAGRASRQLATAQLQVATELGAHAVSLATVVGPFFAAQPDEMFALDQFHPSGAGYRRTAKALLPSVLAALGYRAEVPFGHHPPVMPVPAPPPAGSRPGGR